MRERASGDSSVLRTLGEETRWIERTITSHVVPGRRLEILEAGCGRQWAMNLEPVPYVLTGVDLSEAALDFRKNEVKDLDVAIHGDLADVELKPESYDVTYCAYVLEHVHGVARVLDNFDRWTSPGGLIVLRLPDRDSVVGALARLTPHRSHVWYYRYLLRRPLAGTQGRAPFQTVYEKAISRGELRRFFAARGYAIVGEVLCRPFPGQDGRLWNAVRGLLRAVGVASSGRLSGGHNNFTIIVRKAD